MPKDLQQSLLADNNDDVGVPIETEWNDDNTPTPYMPWYKNWKNWIKISILIAVVVFLVLAVVYNKITSSLFNSFLTWMQNHAVIGTFAFIGIYWFCTIFMIPGSLLTLGAGFVFRAVLGQWAGIFLATLIVWIGACLGAISAFIIGRFVLRSTVAGFKAKYEKFKIVDQVIEMNGFKVTLLLRLSPIIPFNLFNYFMGLTSVTLKAYTIASVGMIPGTLAYCFIGGTLGALTDAGSVGFSNPTVLIFTIVGTVLALIGMIYIGYVAKKEFNKLAAQINNDNVNLIGIEHDDQSQSNDLQYSNL